jgi:hypothetical protein
MKKERRPAMSVEEMEGQDSPVLAVLKHYGGDLTRGNYVEVHTFGTGDSDQVSADEEHWPEQFRRETLVETPPLSGEIQ